MEMLSKRIHLHSALNNAGKTVNEIHRQREKANRKNTLKTKQTIDDSVFMIYYFFSKTQAK